MCEILFFSVDFLNLCLMVTLKNKDVTKTTNWIKALQIDCMSFFFKVQIIETKKVLSS